MRRNRPAFLLAVLLWLLLSGCGADTSATPQHTVTLVAKSTQTEFWLSVFAGAEAAATEYNLQLTIVGPETEEDYESQNTMVAQAVEDGAEALVFSAIDYENNAAAIDAAARKGVKVVAIDSSVDSDQVSIYIGTDNYAAGQMAAQAALDRVAGELKVGVVNYDISSANGQERERGATDVFAQSGRAEITAVINTLAEAEQAEWDAAAMLQNHPEINVLLAFNEPTSVGAAQAVKELGLSETVFLVGFDSNVATVDGMQEGSVDALIVQNPYAMGYLGVESAYKLLTGQEGGLEHVVDTSTQIVDRSNLFTMDSQKALFAFEQNMD
ncbi:MULTISPECIES: substrate-binding domain-containing protein [Oscillospiraceae]|uniref:substrate-binding domain-containing protein n=1 Tax=Oscillospiraceae TaxID=216572 RepID=UPI000B3995F0|nr:MULTISPECIES: substrate-binding domain-containing protein [Oscillospiraceae]MBM6884378.1 substrate-binding domain-containing protein [Pseudoflavonifractor phocaeensis]OUO41919.1 LacI family transcriptional regulator [Flavonifractor sp. An306]